jgi:AP-1 complex subunit beta-1
LFTFTQRDAIKKVIAAMTVGKDVSSLFPDMINSMQTASLEIKKLTYLYVINYAKSQPELAVMGVNTFRRDANDPNPLIRALAIRTMGCVRVDKIVEYLCEPLRRCLRDDDPYVRKTAALCVAKLNDLDPELCADQGFIEMLRDLISDANPAVVANAVAALAEIAEVSSNPSEIFSVTPTVLHKLLAALNECSEWGQVFILDALGGYVPRDGPEAEQIVERVTPRLQHSNAAVVMGAVKVISRYLDLIPDQDTRRLLSKKLAPPLVTLISSNAPEIQYVALRNIQLIVAARPDILHKDIKVFFCKFNDPLFVKMEKLEVLILLVREATANEVLGELKEYASEVDVEFVRRSVRAIGRTAIKLERTAERCVNVLIELIQTRVSYVVQEAVVTIKDIFRRYPNRYESVIAVLCENLESLDEPAAKASMIWIVGENADRIDNAAELLETFVDTFFDEVADVQLQLLTAVVKLFLVRSQSRALMDRVLRLCTEESDNPDLRDRAFIYWRLLSSNPEAARRVVLGEKPVIEDDSNKIDEALLTELLEQVSSLASVYHKPARSFVKRVLPGLHSSTLLEGGEDSSNGGNNNGAGTGTGAGEEEEGPSSDQQQQQQAEEEPSNLIDLDSSFGGGAVQDVLAASRVPDLPRVLNPTDEKSKGLGINATFKREDGTIFLQLVLHAPGGGDFGEKFAIKFKQNTFALVPAKAAFVTVDGPVSNNARRLATVDCKVDTNNANKGAPPSLVIEMALKINKTGDIVYFEVKLPFYCLFLERPQQVDARSTWTQANLAMIEGGTEPNGFDAAAVTKIFNENRIVSLNEPGFFALTTSTGASCIVRLTNPNIQVKCVQKPVLPFVLEALQELVKKASAVASSSGSSGGGAAVGNVGNSNVNMSINDLFGNSGSATSTVIGTGGNNNSLTGLF